MKKNILCLLLLLGFAACLKISHLEQAAAQPADAAAAATTTPAPETKPANDLSDKIKIIQAYERFLQFVGNDKQMSKSVLKGKENSESSQNRLRKFLAQDEYFQKQLLAKLLENPANSWVKELNFEDQIKYLKMSTSLTEAESKDPVERSKAVAALLEDPDIGAALKKKYGDDINVEDIIQTSNVSIDPAH